MTALLVVAGAAVGAPLRYLVDRAVQRRLGAAFPGGTLTVNLLACLVLGALAGAGTALPPGIPALVGTGFCGALSTYSTVGWDTVRLVEDGAWRTALGYVTLSVAAGVGAALAAYGLVGLLAG